MKALEYPLVTMVELSSPPAQPPQHGKKKAPKQKEDLYMRLTHIWSKCVPETKHHKSQDKVATNEIMHHRSRSSSSRLITDYVGQSK